MRENSVKRALRSGEAQVGAWLSLASVTAARIMARMGFHWLTVDVEHSPVDWETAAAMFGAIAEAGCVPIARVPANSVENVKRALDSGAYGVIFPMCCSAQEAADAVSACKYPPEGRRSVGGSLHALNFQTSPAEYYRRANEEILVIVQAEHVSAVERCDEIFSVPGIDAMFVGPNDLMASMNLPPAMDSGEPAFVDALERLLASARRNNIAPGIHNADAAMARRRIDRGWRFVAVSSDLGLMSAAARKAAEDVVGAVSGPPAARY
jgi:4-hydroxy-2-oxoheptanedioate aldolase